jgi:hypothetical protein
MAAPDNLETRVAALETQDFRQATTASFNAMRQDLVDLRTHVGDGFTEMRGKLDTTAAGQQHVVDLLTTLIDQQGGQAGDE